MRDSSKTRTRTKVLAAALVAVGISVLMLAITRDGSSLMDKATKVTSLGEDESWHWVGDRSVLLIDCPLKGKPSVRRLDSKTGARKALPELNSFLSQFQDWPKLKPSPNGKWLVVIPWSQLKDVHLLVDVESGKLAAQMDSGPFLSWLPDSSAWLAHRKKRNGIHVLRTEGKSEPRRIIALSRPEMDLGFGPSGEFVTVWYDPYYRSDLELRGMDLNRGQVLWLRKAPLPPGALLSEVNISPDHQQLVWQTRPGLAGGPAAFMTELFARILQRPATNALWVSRIDGREMRRLGDAEVEFGTDYDCDLSGVQWLPDGKRVGFSYKGNLYSVNVQ